MDESHSQHSNIDDGEHLQQHNGRIQVLLAAFETYQRRVANIRNRLSKVREVVKSDLVLIQKRRKESIGNEITITEPIEPPEGLQELYNEIVHSADSLINNSRDLENNKVEDLASASHGSALFSTISIIQSTRDGGSYSDATTEWSSINVPELAETIAEDETKNEKDFDMENRNGSKPQDDTQEQDSEMVHLLV